MAQTAEEKAAAKAAKEQEKAAAKAAKEQEKAAAKADPTSAVVTVGDGHLRTYTLETHGESFADLANELAAHTKDAKVELV